MKRKKTDPSAHWPASFSKADMALFKKHRIPAELVVDAGILRVTDREASRKRIRGSGDMAGLWFPNFDWRTGKEVTGRVRRDTPENGKDGKEENKYMGPKGESALYYPPDTKAKLAARADILFVLVEAQKSVLALTAWADRMGIGDQLLPIGMNGCWGWSKDKQPLPDLDLFEGRSVLVLMDANSVGNPMVSEAEIALSSQLRSRACDVGLLRLPQMEGVNGPDDLLALPDGDKLMEEVFAGKQQAVVAPYSEHALAGRLNAEKKDELLYVPTQGWLTWTGHNWRYDEKGEAEMAAQTLCEKAAGERAKQLEQNRIRSRHTREAVMREAQPLFSRATAKDLDKDNMLLGTEEKTMELRTGGLREASREDYITKLTAVSPDTKCETKLWKKFLHEITNGDKDLIAYLQRVCGYCLTGDTSEHVLFFLYGTGANGKSVFVNTLLGVLGDYASVAPMELFTATRNPKSTTSLAALRGARLVVATETEAGSRWAEAMLKSITGGEPITARFLYQRDFTFVPQFKLMLSGNHRPRLHNVDEAMRRRIHMVPFVVTIPPEKRDKQLAANLKKEWPGILQWAIEGCLEWQRLRKENGDGLRPPQAVLAATKDYFEQQDVLGQWLEAETVSTGKAQSGDVYRAFKGWAEARGEYVWAQKEFSQKLVERGFDTEKSNGIRYIKGLRLKTAEERGAKDKPVGAARRFARGKLVTMRK